MPKRKELVRQFDFRQAHPVVWLDKARCLKRSADLCSADSDSAWERFSAEHTIEIGDEGNRQFNQGLAQYESYCLLVAMSLENCLKAAILIAGKDQQFTHDLVSLADTADIKLSDEDKKTISKLTDYIYWQGKYPAPKPRDQEEWVSSALNAGSLSPPRFGPRSFEIIEPVYAKIMEEVVERYDEWRSARCKR